MTEDFELGPEVVFPDDWIGPGKRYATVEDMARDAMRWHDEAQAEKLHSMRLEGLGYATIRLTEHGEFNAIVAGGNQEKLFHFEQLGECLWRFEYKDVGGKTNRIDLTSETKIRAVLSMDVEPTKPETDE